MAIGQQILFFFSALGAFNGFIISAYLLVFKKSKSPAAIFLGLFLLALSIRITKAIFSYFFPSIPRIYLQIGLSGCFLIGPSLYYFTKAALHNLQITPITWKLIYGFWIATIVLIGLVYPYSSHPYAWNNYIVHFIYVQWALYCIGAAWLVRMLFARLFSRNLKLSSNEKSILSVFIGHLIIFTAYLLVFMGSFRNVYIGGALFFSLLLYLNIPLFMNRRKLGTSFLGQEDTSRYANKKIDSDYAAALTSKLDGIIVSEELYKNPDLKLNDLARKINISAHQLSQLLNDNLGKSFAAYINEYRVNEACNLIAANSTIKLEAIGYEVGFNSKSTFYTAFRKHKQTTPTLFKEKLSDSVTVTIKSAGGI